MQDKTVKRELSSGLDNKFELIGVTASTLQLREKATTKATLTQTTSSTATTWKKIRQTR